MHGSSIDLIKISHANLLHFPRQFDSWEYNFKIINLKYICAMNFNENRIKS